MKKDKIKNWEKKFDKKFFTKRSGCKFPKRISDPILGDEIKNFLSQKIQEAYEKGYAEALSQKDK
jgi:hypothetical protein